MIPTARSTTISGLYLIKRAKDLARWILRTRMYSKKEVIDGYMVTANRTGNVATGLVLDMPGTIVVFHRSAPDHESGWAVYSAGTRDNYDSRLNTPDGTYSAENEPLADLKNWFWGFGFDPNETLPPPLQTPWQGSAVSVLDGSHIYKRELLINSRTKVYPSDSFRGGATYPTRGATEVFSTARVISHASSMTPGFAFLDSWLSGLTDGYVPIRNVAIDLVGGYEGPAYVGFEYQGDAPVLAYQEQTALIVIPVVNNLDQNLYSGIVHWGHSGVLFLLYDIPGPASLTGNRPILRWSRLWSPDEHGVDFFHNGPWVSRPSPNLNPPFTSVRDFWDDWWDDWTTAGKPTPAGGSRPNWTDAISATWHGGRFVVSLRCCALNGVDDSVGSFRTAGGSAYVRFEVVPTDESADLTVEELSYEIWDAPERRPFDDPLYIPYTRWVVGALDTAVLSCVNPLCTFTDSGRLLEVTWKMEGDRRVITFPTGSGGLPAAQVDTGRIEVRITDEEAAVITHTVNFTSLGYGVVGPALNYSGTVYLVPPTQSYKMRALESQFVMISANELAFLARQTWVFSDSSPFEYANLIILNLGTGIAARRSQIPIRMPISPDHLVPSHLDCVQQTIFDEEGQVVIEGVLIATGPDATSTAFISRDSGETWTEYVTEITDGAPQRAVYYIGNPLGGGSRPGHAIL